MGEHSGFCIKTVLQGDDPPMEVNTTEGFDFAEALESVYPLLDIIFDYLSDKDLENVAKVKKSWQEITSRLLKKRSKLCWVSCFQKHKSNFLKHSGNLHYNNANIGIILFDCRLLKLSDFICLHKSTDKLYNMPFVEYISNEIVNKKMSYCLLSCPRVVSFFKSDIENCNGSIFDALFLPDIPGIRTTMFYCNPLKLKKNSSLLESYIDANEEVRCLLLFALNDLHRSIDNLFKVLIKNSKPEDIAVGGGIIHGSKSFQNPQNSKKIISSNDTFCIAFLKEKNSDPEFSAASFVISGNGFSKQEISEKLERFKKRVLLRANSIAVRICCGAKWGKDDESVIFSKHFPNTPLLGLEADGEIGWDCFNLPDNDDCSESKPKKSKRLYPKVEHEWSTVFVIISWGIIKKK